MPPNSDPKYYLVEASMMPEIFLKVTRAKELLETGEVKTVGKAVELVGISRSAYYKYKDYISPFLDMKRGQIITFHLVLRDRMGVLSSVLAVFAESGSNILTINQSIPISGKASVTISVETEGLSVSMEEMIEQLSIIGGVIKVELVAG